MGEAQEPPAGQGFRHLEFEIHHAVAVGRQVGIEESRFVEVRAGLDLGKIDRRRGRLARPGAGMHAPQGSAHHSAHDAALVGVLGGCVRRRGGRGNRFRLGHHRPGRRFHGPAGGAIAEEILGDGFGEMDVTGRDDGE